MSHTNCWECGKDFAQDEVFDIPVFKKDFTIKWCFKCANKQLKWTDYRLITKKRKYSHFIYKCTNCKTKFKTLKEGKVHFKKVKHEWGGLEHLRVKKCIK